MGGWPASRARKYPGQGSPTITLRALARNSLRPFLPERPALYFRLQATNQSGTTTKTGTPARRAKRTAAAEPGEGTGEDRKTTRADRPEATRHSERRGPAARPKRDQEGRTEKNGRPAARREERTARSTTPPPPEQRRTPGGTEAEKEETRPGQGKEREPTTPRREPEGSAATNATRAGEKEKEDTHKDTKKEPKLQAPKGTKRGRRGHKCGPIHTNLNTAVLHVL